jgi:hypothetical protein
MMRPELYRLRYPTSAASEVDSHTIVILSEIGTVQGGALERRSAR